MTQTTITYHISQGAGTKMYTLWQEIMSEHFYKCRFVQNLSIDKEKAFIKAKEIAGDRELYDDSVDQLKKSLERSPASLILENITENPLMTSQPIIFVGLQMADQ